MRTQTVMALLAVTALILAMNEAYLLSIGTPTTLLPYSVPFLIAMIPFMWITRQNLFAGEFRGKWASIDRVLNYKVGSVPLPLFLLAVHVFIGMINDIASSDLKVERISAIWPSFVATAMYLIFQVTSVINRRQLTVKA